ncbi:diadenylate cyclase [Amycolatopsis sp. CA-128772]|uniref:diadenylate cyclase n=1 Tax=Amycolatopsis sp. CA-128772 TaxID=2073159 RepID=UPI001304F6FC|nr:diadenylate cyclase [Amycolatopsis sp. CA-128772]
MLQYSQLPAEVRAGLAFGQPLRDGIELARARGRGTIVVLGCGECHASLMSGGDSGIWLTTGQAIFTNAQVDGATILGPGLESIVRKYVNLEAGAGPDATDPGARHAMAAGFAAQSGHPVIAVSNERKQVTLYMREERLLLRAQAELKATVEGHLQLLRTMLTVYPQRGGSRRRLPADERVRAEAAIRAIQEDLAELGSQGAVQAAECATIARELGLAEAGPVAASEGEFDAVPRLEEPEVRLLGEVYVEDKLVKGFAADVLIMLALSDERRIPVHVLQNALGEEDESALEEGIVALRESGLGIAKERGDCFLESEPVLDSDEFMTGVRDLPESPRPGQVDRLLSLWRGDPAALHPNTSGHWHEVYRVRNELLKRIRKMTVHEQRGLPGLKTFIAHFAANKLPSWVSGVASLNGRVGDRKRVLIVEDRMADTFVDVLGRHYDCVPLRSLPDWRQFSDEDDLDFDAALVDLHLTAAGNDAQGVAVLEHLRDNDGPPAMLISSAPEAGDIDALKEKYGLSGVYLKGPNDSLPDLVLSMDRVIRKGRPALK